MKKVIATSIVAILLVMLITTSITTTYSQTTYALTKAERKASDKIEKKIEDALEKFVKNDYRKYCTVSVTTGPEQNPVTLYQKNCAAPPNQEPTAKIQTKTQAEVGEHVTVNGESSSDSDGSIVSYRWTGENSEGQTMDFQSPSATITSFVFPQSQSVRITLTVIDDKGASGSTSVIISAGTPEPEPCPDGTHREGDNCVPNPTPDPTCAVAKPSGWVRIGITADTHVGGPEFNLIDDCGANINGVAGDLWYDDSSGEWFEYVEGLGWTKSNTVIAIGNHDSSSTIRSWMGKSTSYYSWNTADGKIDFVVLDGKESGMNCDSTQYDQASDWLQSSDAMYKFVMIHEPFVTVKSDHPPNGGFSCWHSLFRTTGVSAVFQGHNHFYAHAVIDGIDYTVGPAGTHDKGGGLYACGGTSFEGHPMKCIRDNGALFVDVALDHKEIRGTAIGLDNKVFHTFVN